MLGKSVVYASVCLFNGLKYQFQPIVKLFVSPNRGVYFLSTMGIALVNWPAGPMFEYSRDFCFKLTYTLSFLITCCPSASSLELLGQI